jgi:non-ribosomal peptide synthetase component E (peptide arylation enzyme)
MTTYPYLTQVVHGAARSRPDQLCLICGDRRTTNAQFRERVARLAGALRRIGVGPDDRLLRLLLGA